jgi:hypothetical protein
VQLPVARSETSQQMTRFVDYQEQAQLKKTKIFTCPFFYFSILGLQISIQPLMPISNTLQHIGQLQVASPPFPQSDTYSVMGEVKDDPVASKRFLRQFFLVQFNSWHLHVIIHMFVFGICHLPILIDLPSMRFNQQAAP